MEDLDIHPQIAEKNEIFELPHMESPREENLINEEKPGHFVLEKDEKIEDRDRASDVNVPQHEEVKQINWLVIWKLPRKSEPSTPESIISSPSSESGTTSKTKNSNTRLIGIIPDLQAGKWKFECWVKGPHSSLLTGDKIKLTLISRTGIILKENIKLHPSNNYDISTYEFEIEESYSPATLELSRKSSILPKVDLRATLSRLMEGKQESDVPDVGLLNIDELDPKEKELVDIACEGWSSFDSFVLDFDFEPAIKQLSRRSQRLTEAKKLNLVRPFLFLVSMHPIKRLFWAKAIGINLLKKKYYPDAHEEAWDVVWKSGDSIRVKAGKAFSEKLNPFSSNISWHDVVYRVTSTVFVKRPQLWKKNNEVDHDLRAMIKSCKKNPEDKKREQEAVVVKLSKSTSPSLREGTSVVNRRQPGEDSRKSIGSQLSQRRYSAVETNIFEYKEPNSTKRIEEAFCIALMYKMKERISPHEEKLKYLERLAFSEKGLELRHNLLQNGWLNEEHINLKVGLNLDIDGSKDLLMHMMGWTSSKQAAKAGNYAMLAIPMVMLFVSPYAIIPVLMLSRNLTALIFKSDPGALLPIIIGIISQRIWLELVNIRVEDFYLA